MPRVELHRTIVMWIVLHAEAQIMQGLFFWWPSSKSQSRYNLATYTIVPRIIHILAY
ncbi:MAG: hypothetical protein ACI9Y1_001160 [Lentisphaeria bacterium]|jgi:hypothetical protein